jgi:hypothetical protein
MLIARDKRKSNIAEYILYMWQVEDIIRACQFNIDLIERNYIDKFSKPGRVRDEIRDWYANLILMMHEEDIREKGHLSFVNALVRDLDDLHIRLLNNPDEGDYHGLYMKAVVNLREFKGKLSTPLVGDIEACLDALYGLLLLRLRKKEISSETGAAMATFSNLLAHLSSRFHQVERGEAEI